MAKSQKMQKKPAEKPAQLFQPKDFLDRIAPAAVKFNTDSYVLGGLYRCVLALRGYPAVTEELALLIAVAVDRMPEQRRRVFSLSRYEELSNKEIAERLNLSVKTVERHMTAALSQLRRLLTLLALFV